MYTVESSDPILSFYEKCYIESMRKGRGVIRKKMVYKKTWRGMPDNWRDRYPALKKYKVSVEKRIVTGKDKKTYAQRRMFICFEMFEDYLEKELPFLSEEEIINYKIKLAKISKEERNEAKRNKVYNYLCT